MWKMVLSHAFSALLKKKNLEIYFAERKLFLSDCLLAYVYVTEEAISRHYPIIPGQSLQL